AAALKASKPKLEAFKAANGGRSLDLRSNSEDLVHFYEAMNMPAEVVEAMKTLAVWFEELNDTTRVLGRDVPGLKGLSDASIFTIAYVVALNSAEDQQEMRTES